MLQHANFNLVFNAPWLDALFGWGQFWPGVDLFFVISGYLIAGGLLRGMGAPGMIARMELARFWTRRAWRLWPVSWLWLGLIVLGSLMWQDPPFLGTVAMNLRGALAGICGYANLRFAALPGVPYGASFPYWSLALEEQFYLLLPLAILGFGRHLRWAVFVAILVQLPLSHGRWFTFLRSDALLWGVALAAWRGPGLARLEPTFLRRKPLAPLMILACLAGLVRLAGPGDSSPPFVIGYIAALSALLVWLASYDRGYICSWPALRPVALWAGSRSYALYLAHVPAYLCAAALAHHMGAPGENLFSGAGNVRAIAICVPGLLIAAEATHRFVEVPLRNYGARLSDRLATRM